MGRPGVGLAMSGPGRATAQDLLRAADTALYAAMDNGCNRVETAGG